MKIGSLCTGYGGLDMAAHAVFGGDLAWVSDIDDGACKVLAHQYPDVPNLGDLTTTDWAGVEPVDVLTAGYPCQPFSHAGQRKGLDDERHIWPHIQDAIGVLRPRVVVLENVAGHLSLGGPAVIAGLTALGYDARWVVVRAADVGACHRRARLFILAGDTDCAERWPHALSGGCDRQGQYDEGEAPSRSEQPSPPSAANAEGNEQREPADRVGERPEPGRSLAIAADSDCSTRGGAGSASLAVLESRTQQRPRRCDRVDFGPFTDAIERHGRAVGRPAPNPLTTRTQLNPVFVEWMMMLPEGWVTDVPTMSRTAQLKALGNGVVPPQAAKALALLTPIS